MFDVVTIADLCADLIIVGQEKPCFGQVEKLADSYELELGGSAAIFSSQFSKLGGKAALVSMVGNDTLGSFLINRMNELGIDSSQVAVSEFFKTSLGLNISINGDRSMLTVMGSMSEISFQQIHDDLIDKTRHWHIAGYFLLEQLQPFWLEFLKKLKRKNISTSLDTNWAPQGNWKQVIELLPYLDVFLPNENEAMAIANKTDYVSAGVQLSASNCLIVIKRGSAGASVFKNGIEFAHAIPSEILSQIQVVDTTGAGDSFDGGFIFEWLRNSSIEVCLRTGIACGTCSVQKAGGINGQLLPS